MSEVVNIFDAFYTRFVLRDVFAKIAPGFILISVAATSLTSPCEVITYVASMSFWAWAMAFSLAWIAGFSIQGFAEKFKLVRYYPKIKNFERKDFYDMKLLFDENATLSEKHDVERLVVIKEACGNGYVALSISLSLLIADGILDAYRYKLSFFPWIFSEFLRVCPVLIVVLAAIYYLRYMHFEHVQRQYDFMERAIFKKEFPDKFKSSTLKRFETQHSKNGDN